MSYAATLAYIHSVKWQGSKPGLSRTQTLLAALGNPERKLKFVHIAGTNGKGSTAACLAACLQAAGYRVGLYTSPYINRFNERLQVDGAPIPDETLEQLVDHIRPHADAMADAPTEFELITALGFLYFARERCDIVVLEVGLGGTLDSTNVIGPPEAAVITALGKDHMAVLGNSMAQIAQAKAGIIKGGCPVISYGGDPEADRVIAETCRRTGSPLYPVDFGQLTVQPGSLAESRFDFGPLKNLTLPLIGSYQPKNAATAITTLKVLAQRGWDIPDSAIRAGLAAVQWPGRFELLRSTPPFLLDGSHNPPGMEATRPESPGQIPGPAVCLSHVGDGGQGCGGDSQAHPAPGKAVCSGTGGPAPGHARPGPGRAHPGPGRPSRDCPHHPRRGGAGPGPGRRNGAGLRPGDPVLLRRCAPGSRGPASSIKQLFVVREDLLCQLILHNFVSREKHGKQRPRWVQSRKISNRNPCLIFRQGFFSSYDFSEIHRQFTGRTY